jgi:2-oxoglutarate ferredoxin oxidoreductase subunit gamma
MEITFAGFGGQGVLTSGLILTYIAMKSGYEVMWSPSYGGQMRGGQANSTVKLDKKPINDPLMTKLDVLVAMNDLALDFVKDLKKDGLLIINADVDQGARIFDSATRVIRLPISKLATEAKSPRAANVVSIGTFVKATEIFDKDKAIKIMCEYFEQAYRCV